MVKWEKIRDRKIAGNISILYEKGDTTLELFRDSYWGKKSSMNVIVRDSKIPSYSLLGKSIDVYHAETMKEAKDWAKEYMKNH